MKEWLNFVNVGHLNDPMMVHEFIYSIDLAIHMYLSRIYHKQRPEPRGLSLQIANLEVCLPNSQKTKWSMDISHYIYGTMSLLVWPTHGDQRTGIVNRLLHL